MQCYVKNKPTRVQRLGIIDVSCS